MHRKSLSLVDINDEDDDEIIIADPFNMNRERDNSQNNTIPSK
jgi:hypothetical protein